MKKKHGVLFAVLALGCLMLAACIIDIPLTAARSFWGPEDNPYTTDGEISGTALGWPGFDVTVYITLEDGYISSFRFEGGYSLLTYRIRIESIRPNLEDTIITSNSFDFPVVVGSGATSTLRGIRTAGRNALMTLPSITDADFTLND